MLSATELLMGRPDVWVDGCGYDIYTRFPPTVTPSTSISAPHILNPTVTLTIIVTLILGLTFSLNYLEGGWVGVCGYGCGSAQCQTLIHTHPYDPISEIYTGIPTLDSCGKEDGKIREKTVLTRHS